MAGLGNALAMVVPEAQASEQCHEVTLFLGGEGTRQLMRPVLLSFLHTDRKAFHITDELACTWEVEKRFGEGVRLSPEKKGGGGGGAQTSQPLYKDSPKLQTIFIDQCIRCSETSLALPCLTKAHGFISPLT